MKQISFRCDKDGIEFQLNSGLTKSQVLERQNGNTSSNSDLSTSLIVSDQFDEFVAAISEHSKQCDGHIVVNPASYAIID